MKSHILSKYLIAYLFFLCSFFTSAQEFIFQPGSNTGKDTYFGTGSVGGHNGRPDAEELRIGGWGDNWTSFIEFDLSTIPTGSTIVSAYLHLFNHTSKNQNNGKLFRVTKFWNEASPSDTSSPNFVDFGMQFQPVPNNDWWKVDVSNVVINWHNGIYPNYGFKMLGEFNCCNQVKHFWSSDYSANPLLRPKLVVTIASNNSSPPIVNALNVSPKPSFVGTKLTISYSVSATGNSRLTQAELWKASDNGGKPANDWQEIQRSSLSGNNSISSSFVDYPPSAGTYWYGVHVVDSNGDYNDEQNSQTNNQPGIYGPIQVTINPFINNTSFPTVNAFNVSPLSGSLGTIIKISYAVSATGNSKLVRAELWKASDSNGSPADDWKEINRSNLSGKGFVFGSFSDIPLTGNYWYGLHVVDSNGNYNDEQNSQSSFQPGIYGPINVTINPKSGQQLPFLSFPLECGEMINNSCNLAYSQGAYTPKRITSVLDHHMDSEYLPRDDIVLAFTGEKGEDKKKPANKCYPKKDNESFNILGLYKGTPNDGCDEKFLNYDNHPGYDYVAAEGTSVWAAAEGIIINVNNENSEESRCLPMGISEGCKAWGYVGIDHENGYITQYGHLKEIKVIAGQRVFKNTLIGLTGNASPPSKTVGYHLHFEILKEVKNNQYAFVDPYGWEGNLGEDYLAEEINNFKNIRLWEYDPRECLLNWAEQKYNHVFSPKNAITKKLYPFIYRYYKNTDTYLGITSKNNHILYKDSDKDVYDPGELKNWLLIANCQSPKRE